MSCTGTIEVFGFKSNEFVEHGREFYETGTECNHRKYQTNYLLVRDCHRLFQPYNPTAKVRININYNLFSKYFIGVFLL